MIRQKKHAGKESKHLGLADSSPSESPEISTIRIDSSVEGSFDAAEQSEARKKRRRRRKNRDNEVPDYPEDDIVKSMKMLESDVVMVTDGSKSKGVDVQNIIVQSTPVGKVFVENDRGFKAIAHSNSSFPSQNEQNIYEKSPEQRLMGLAVSADRWMYSFGVICRGLLGGMSLCHIISIVEALPSQRPWNFFVEHILCYSQPFHTCWCFLLIVAIVTVLDRVDLNVLSEKRLWSVFELRFLSALIYSVSLCITLSIHAKQEMFTFSCNRNITDVRNQIGSTSEMEEWRMWSLAASAATVIGWLLVGISLQPDDVPPYL